MLITILEYGILLLSIRISQISSMPMANLNAESSARQEKGLEMLKYMNLSMDPCEDFYEFTCGNWNKFHSAALEDEPSTGFLEMLQKVLDTNIRNILESSNAKDNEIDRKIKDFYRSCLNLPNLEKVYANKLKKIVEEFGQMPALEETQWDSQHFNWLELVAKIAHKYGISIIAGVDVAVDLADNTVNRLYLNQQDLALERKSVYLDKDKESLIRALILSVATKLNQFLDMDLERAIQTAVEIVDFESSLAKGIVDFQSVAEFQQGHPLASIEEIQQQFGEELDFQKLIRLSLDSIPELKVYYSRRYLENLIHILKITPKRKVANYIFYQLIDKFLVTIPQSREELQDNCLSNMKSYFSKKFDNMVYHHFASKQVEEGIDLMWLQLKSAFRQSLESLNYNWISPTTRHYAIKKLEAMQMEVVSYDNYDFQEAFGDLRVDSEDYLENLKMLRSLGAKQNLEAINDPPEPLDLGEQLSTSPAHILVENLVKVPVAFLQPNYVWSPHLAKAFNFGVLGALLGHELIHGFDDNGRNHDIQGNSVQWWDPQSSFAFQQRALCFNDQYRKFIFHGKHLPDMKAQGENIADNGGVRLAYTAYLQWYEKALKDMPAMINESMPGLEFRDKKLFFISYGQLWCGDVNPLYRKLQESIDSHVPDRFRVIGPLSNFEEFSKVFNCPLGSAMNPAKKCRIY